MPGSGSSNKPLSYTDVVIVQWKNPSGRDVDTPNGDTENCGWYGCRVLQPPNAQDSSKVPTFDHGGSSPAKVMLMAPPSLVKAGNYNGPIHDGDPVCFQWAGSPTNWGFTGNCGWMGCRILTDYLGKPPAGTTGEYGWDHGGGKDEPGGGPIGYPNGPTVFNLRIAPPPHKPSPMDACDIWSEGCGVMPIKACVSPDPAVKGVGGAECNIDSACLADPNCKGVWRSGNGCSKMTCTNTQPAFGHCVRIPQKPSQFAGKFVYVKDKYDFNASKTSDGDSVYYVQWPNVIRYVPGDGKGGFAGTAQNCHANYETWKGVSAPPYIPSNFESLGLIPGPNMGDDDSKSMTQACSKQGAWSTSGGCKPIDGCAAQVANKCSTCKPGYTLKDNTCLATPIDGCKTQTGATCSACNTGYLLNDNKCSANSIPGCKTQTGATCSACTSGYNLVNNKCSANDIPGCKDMDGATCNQCLKGYVLKNNKCILTPMSGCQVQEGEICKSCYEGYLLKDNACMTLPIDNCSKQVGHECQVCRDGYKLNDNQCEVKRSWKCKGDHCSTKKGKKTRSNCSPDLTCDPKCNQTWGRCANGICVCGGGYSGVSCNIPPAPVETDKEKILYKLNKKEEKQKKKDDKNRPIALSYPKHEHVKENQPFTDELKKIKFRNSRNCFNSKKTS